MKKFEETVAWLIQAASTEAGKKAWQDVQTDFQQIQTLDRRLRELATAGDRAGATRLIMVEARAMTDKIEETINARMEANRDQMKQADTDTDALYTSTRNILLGVAALAVFAAIATATWIAMSISNGLNKIKLVCRSRLDR